MNAGQGFARSAQAWKEDGVKGKPFQSRPRELQASEARPFSLKKPLASQISKIDWQSDKFSSEQWRFLNRIFAQFAELLPSNLTPILQLRAIVELEEAENGSFKDFIEQFPEPTPFAAFTLNEKTKGLWVFDGPLAFSILDYLTGGKGEPPDDAREFTDIERALFAKLVLARFSAAYGETWKEMGQLNPQADQIEFSPHQLALFPYSETLVTARFTLRLGATTGSFHLAIPFRHVREVLPRNPDEYVTQSAVRKVPENQPSLAPFVGKKIEAAALSISVELGKAEVPFQDLLHLEEGDILRLDSLRGEPLKIKISGKTKFLGKPGSSENKVAIQITHAVPEGDESFDE